MSRTRWNERWREAGPPSNPGRTGAITTARSSWKSFERRVARDHGVERKPVSGRQRDQGGEDTEPHPLFAIQCKLGYHQPAYLRHWLDGICRAAGSKVGIVIWKPLGQRDDEAVVVLRYKDWVALHGSTFDEPAWDGDANPLG